MGHPLRRRGGDGVERNVWFQGHRVGKEREYFDQLLLRLLAHHDPLWGDWRSLDVNWKVDVSVAVVGAFHSISTDDGMRLDPADRERLVEIVKTITARRKAVVRRTDGKRIDDLIFKVTDGDGRVPVHVVLSNEPDRRDPLAPGAHRLEIREKGIETFSKEIEVREGKETAIEVEVKPVSGTGG